MVKPVAGDVEIDEVEYISPQTVTGSFEDSNFVSRASPSIFSVRIMPHLSCSFQHNTIVIVNYVDVCW